MSQIQTYQLPTIDLTYPAVTLDNAYGTTVQIPLYRTQLVRDYILSVTQGTLNGGTSPTWATSSSKPLITHVRVEANNNVIFDADAQMIQFYEQWVEDDSPDGLHWKIRIADVDLRTKQSIDATGMPSYSFNQVIMSVTVDTLADQTTGSPTSTTGTTLSITEESAPRSAVTFQPLLVKHLQISTSLSTNGVNDLTSFLSQDGAYSSMLMYADTGSSGYAAASDSAISKVALILNSTMKVRDAYWTALKAQNQNVTGVKPATGVSAFVFKDQLQASKLLNLKNTAQITNVDLQATTTVSSCRIVALKTEYF